MTANPTRTVITAPAGVVAAARRFRLQQELARAARARVRAGTRCLVCGDTTGEACCEFGAQRGGA